MTEFVFFFAFLLFTAKKNQIRLFVFWENLRRANLLTVLSDLQLVCNCRYLTGHFHLGLLKCNRYIILQSEIIHFYELKKMKYKIKKGTRCSRFLAIFLKKKRPNQWYFQSKSLYISHGVSFMKHKLRFALVLGWLAILKKSGADNEQLLRSVF